MFQIQVQKNRMALSSKEYMTSGSKNVYVCQFEFSNEWDGLEKVAVFATGMGESGPLPDTTYNQLLGDDNRCFIPWEITKEANAHVFIGVFGTQNETVVLPTVWMDIGTILLGVTTGLDLEPPTPELYEQILAQLKGIKDEVDNIESGSALTVVEGQTVTSGKNLAEQYPCAVVFVNSTISAPGKASAPMNWALYSEPIYLEDLPYDDTQNALFATDMRGVTYAFTYAKDDSEKTFTDMVEANRHYTKSEVDALLENLPKGGMPIVDELVAPYETYEAHDCSTLLNQSLVYSTFSNQSLKVYGELEVGDEFSAYFLYDGERLFPAYRYYGIFVCDEKNADGQDDRIRATLKNFTLIGSQYEAIDTFLTFLKLDALPATNTNITIPYSAIVGIRPHWMNTAHRGFMTVGTELYLIDYRLEWTDHENQTFTIKINTITPIGNSGTTEDDFVTVKEKELTTLAEFVNAIGYQSYTGCIHAIASVVGAFSFANDLVWVSYGKFSGNVCYLTIITADGHVHVYEAVGETTSFSVQRKTEFVTEDHLDLAEGTYFVARSSTVPAVDSTVSARADWFIGKKPIVNQDYRGKWHDINANKWYSVVFTVKTIGEYDNDYQYNILLLSVTEDDALPTGGTTGQILSKKSAENYDTEWVDMPNSGALVIKDTYPITNVSTFTDMGLTINNYIDVLFVNSGVLNRRQDNALVTLSLSGDRTTLWMYTNNNQCFVVDVAEDGSLGNSRWTTSVLGLNVNNDPNHSGVEGDNVLDAIGALKTSIDNIESGVHGVPAGGTTDQILAKKSDADYDTQWIDAPQGGGGSESAAYLVKSPVGTIVIWSGTADNIPTGWQLCDGTKGTPDLRDKFVLGAGTNHAVGDSGGSEEVTLTVEQMPTHSHKVSTSYNNTEGAPRNGTMCALDNLSGTIDAQNSGSSQPHPNMPPYYALCYIMKLTADETDTPDISVDETLTKSPTNKLSVTTPVRTILTQAEYDALPEAQRNKGMYVILEEGDIGSDVGYEWWSPHMVSNNSPQPYVVSGSAVISGNDFFRCFDDNKNTFWHSSDQSGSWIAIDFGTKTSVHGVQITPYVLSTNETYTKAIPKLFSVYGSDDGSEWVKVFTNNPSNEVMPTDGTPREYTFTSIRFRHYKIQAESLNWLNNNFFTPAEIKFYRLKTEVTA